MALGVSQNRQFCTISEILHIEGHNYPDVFIRSRLPMTPMNREKLHGNRSARFFSSKIRKTDTQSDAATLYNTRIK